MLYLREQHVLPTLALLLRHFPRAAIPDAEYERLSPSRLRSMPLTSRPCAPIQVPVERCAARARERHDTARALVRDRRADGRARQHQVHHLDARTYFSSSSSISIPATRAHFAHRITSHRISCEPVVQVGDGPTVLDDAHSLIDATTALPKE